MPPPPPPPLVEASASASAPHTRSHDLGGSRSDVNVDASTLDASAAALATAQELAAEGLWLVARAEHLPSADGPFGLSDPQVRLFITQPSPEWGEHDILLTEEIARTEMLLDNHNPVFERCLGPLPLDDPGLLAEGQLTLRVYDIDDDSIFPNDDDLLGEVHMSLAEACAVFAADADGTDIDADNIQLAACTCPDLDNDRDTPDEHVFPLANAYKGDEWRLRWRRERSSAASTGTDVHALAGSPSPEPEPLLEGLGNCSNSRDSQVSITARPTSTSPVSPRPSKGASQAQLRQLLPPVLILRRATTADLARHAAWKSKRQGWQAMNLFQRFGLSMSYCFVLQAVADLIGTVGAAMAWGKPANWILLLSLIIYFLSHALFLMVFARPSIARTIRKAFIVGLALNVSALGPAYTVMHSLVLKEHNEDGQRLLGLYASAALSIGNTLILVSTAPVRLAPFVHVDNFDTIGMMHMAFASYLLFVGSLCPYAYEGFCQADPDDGYTYSGGDIVFTVAGVLFLLGRLWLCADARVAVRSALERTGNNEQIVPGLAIKTKRCQEAISTDIFESVVQHHEHLHHDHSPGADGGADIDIDGGHGAAAHLHEAVDKAAAMRDECCLQVQMMRCCTCGGRDGDGHGGGDGGGGQAPMVGPVGHVPRRRNAKRVRPIRRAETVRRLQRSQRSRRSDGGLEGEGDREENRRRMRRRSRVRGDGWGSDAGGRSSMSTGSSPMAPALSRLETDVDLGVVDVDVNIDHDGMPMNEARRYPDLDVGTGVAIDVDVHIANV